MSHDPTFIDEGLAVLFCGIKSGMEAAAPDSCR